VAQEREDEMNSDRVKFFIAATWILALIIAVLVVWLEVVKALPLWAFIVIFTITLLAIFAPVIPAGKNSR
jgi:uncharacterized protein (DUF983 family)